MNHQFGAFGNMELLQLHANQIYRPLNPNILVSLGLYIKNSTLEKTRIVTKFIFNWKFDKTNK